MTAVMNFRRIGLKTRNSPTIPTCRSIISASKAVSRYPNGGVKGGSSSPTRGAGFNGIAVITWGGACPKSTRSKSSAGGRLRGTRRRCESTALPIVSNAARANVKVCCNGRTIRLYKALDISAPRRYSRPTFRNGQVPVREGVQTE